jgi:hypothetical protein
METPLPSLNIIDHFILRAIFVVALFLILSNALFVFYAKDIQTMQGLLGEVVKQFDLVCERNFATFLQCFSCSIRFAHTSRQVVTGYQIGELRGHM